MAMFVTLMKYTGTISGGGPQRYAKVQEIAKELGGQITQVYGLLGPWDVMAVSEYPDTRAAMEASARIGNLIGAQGQTMAAVDRDAFLDILTKL